MSSIINQGNSRGPTFSLVQFFATYLKQKYPHSYERVYFVLLVVQKDKYEGKYTNNTLILHNI